MLKRTLKSAKTKFNALHHSLTSQYARPFSVCTLIVLCSMQIITPSQAMAESIPADPLKSMMWEDLAKRFLLNDEDQNPTGQTIIIDNSVVVRAPHIAEDQLNLPIEVDARAIKDAKKIVVIADLNPIPRVLSYEPQNSEARLSFRIKVGQATPVRAAVLDSNNVWHVGGMFVDASGGGCTQPAVAYASDDWVKRLAEVRGKVWRTPGTDIAKLRFIIRHPMDTGLSEGIPAFYIKQLEFNGAGGQQLGRLNIYEPMSENPTITLFPHLKDATQAIEIKGRDNEGNRLKVSVPAPVQSSSLQ